MTKKLSLLFALILLPLMASAQTNNNPDAPQIIPVVYGDEDVVKDLSEVSFNGTRFKTVCYLEIPKAQDAQNFLAELLFGEKKCGVKEAYNKFLKLWKREGLLSTKPGNKGSINIDLRKEYEQYGRFACYHVTASLDGRVQILGLPKTSSVEKQKGQYFKLVNGVDCRFIVDAKQNKMVGIEQVFIPGLVGKIKEVSAPTSVFMQKTDACSFSQRKTTDGLFSVRQQRAISQTISSNLWVGMRYRTLTLRHFSMGRKDWRIFSRSNMLVWHLNLPRLTQSQFP